MGGRRGLPSSIGSGGPLPLRWSPEPLKFAGVAIRRLPSVGSSNSPRPPLGTARARGARSSYASTPRHTDLLLARPPVTLGTSRSGSCLFIFEKKNKA